MLYRIEAGLFPHLDDTIGRKTAASIREALGIPVKSVRTIKVFTLEGLDAQQVNTLMAKSVLHDPVLQASTTAPSGAMPTSVRSSFRRLRTSSRC